MISGAKVRLIFLIAKINAFFFTENAKKQFSRIYETLFPRTKDARILFFCMFAHSLSSGNNEKELVGTLVFIFALYGRT